MQRLSRSPEATQYVLTPINRRQSSNSPNTELARTPDSILFSPAASSSSKSEPRLIRSNSAATYPYTINSQDRRPRAHTDVDEMKSNNHMLSSSILSTSPSALDRSYIQTNWSMKQTQLTEKQNTLIDKKIAALEDLIKALTYKNIDAAQRLLPEVMFNKKNERKKIGTISNEIFKDDALILELNEILKDLRDRRDFKSNRFSFKSFKTKHNEAIENLFPFATASNTDVNADIDDHDINALSFEGLSFPQTESDDDTNPLS